MDRHPVHAMFCIACESHFRPSCLVNCTAACSLIRGRALACQMAPARISQLAAELASDDGSLRLRATASSVAFQGYLAAYFDSAALQEYEEGAAVAAAAAETLEAEDEAWLNESGEGGESGRAAALSRRQQQDAARAAAAAALGELRRGDAVTLSAVGASQHETRPPARYTEG